LANAVTDAAGTARLTYGAPSPASILYVFADGAPIPSVRLASVLGAAQVAPQTVVINEASTVATAFAMAQFLKASSIGGFGPGLQLAAATFRNLMNPATGEVPPFFGPHNQAHIHTLANVLASCVRSKERDACQDLFTESKALGFGTATNTLDAALSIARSPANNVVPLYLLAPRNKPPYTPALPGSPETWAIAIRHSPTAALTPSVNMAYDPAGSLWITDPVANSVAQFDAAGKPVSPMGGLRDRRIRKPQGVRSDTCGNIWIANSGGSSVTKLPGGDFARAVTYEIDARDPYGIAIDGGGNVWITGSGNDRVIKLSPDGKPAPGSPFIVKGLDKPLEIAIDFAGNAWVANSSGRGVTMLRPDGQESRTFIGGGMEGPWGIAVDGNGNIFVSSSKKPALSVLCGSRPEHCPQGKQTGDAISPASGYTSNGVTGLKSVAIDIAGNVWVAGAEGVVEYIGMAAPVASPIIGLPRLPGQPVAGCGK
jgi:streptogramin lyase